MWPLSVTHRNDWWLVLSWSCWNHVGTLGWVCHLMGSSHHFKQVLETSFPRSRKALNHSSSDLEWIRCDPCMWPIEMTDDSSHGVRWTMWEHWDGSVTSLDHVITSNKYLRLETLTRSLEGLSITTDSSSDLEWIWCDPCMWPIEMTNDLSHGVVGTMWEHWDGPVTSWDQAITSNK